MDNLVDPSTADITSRMLELCTVIIRHAQSTHGRPPAFIVQRAQQAVPGIIRFLANKQESDGLRLAGLVGLFDVELKLIQCIVDSS